MLELAVLQICYYSTTQPLVVVMVYLNTEAKVRFAICP